jgi:hypothetical protein
MRPLEIRLTVEIFRDAGPAGLPVDHIGEMNGMDAGKLGELLEFMYFVTYYQVT